MKKLLILAITSLLVFTGCEKVEKTGKYKEGTYMGFSEYESYGSNYVTTAVVYVNASGMIKSVYIDSTYTKDGANTTKKVLGDDYAMKETSANIGVIPGGAEWYEQVEAIEEKVVSEQGLDWVKWNADDNTKLDGISGVTISADSYIEAVTNALNQAK